MPQSDARDTLKQLLTTEGRSLIQEPGRLEGLLKDYLRGGARREITLILGALREGVPAELLSTSVTAMPRELLFERLQGRLEENLAITTDAARWAVETWALALDQMPPGYQTPSPGYQPGHSDRPSLPPGPSASYTPPPSAPPGPGWEPAPGPILQTPPGPTPPGPTPPGPTPVVVVEKASSRATTALILALVGLLCGLLTGIPAALMGSAELRDIREGRASPASKGTAQAALIIGIIVTVGSILYWIAVAITAANSNH